jgi:glucokinase
MSTPNEPRRLLAGDVGGTKTLLGLFETTPARPRPVVIRTFVTLEFADLPSMIDRFLEDSYGRGAGILAACFGVAGPVLGGTASLTNVPWKVEADAISARFAVPHVRLLNDLESLAYAVPALQLAELHELQAGNRRPDGNVAVIAAGTGLGEALLHRFGDRFVPAASEGGHADFAARTEREIALLRALTKRFGRVEVERVVSGPGLVNIFRVVHQGTCAAGVDPDASEAPAEISVAAVDHRCPACVEALDLFVEAYGAEAGNLALRSVATGGVYVGGGIAPKILTALSNGGFMRAFRAKAPLESLLAGIPVNVILNPQAGLLGAAVFASHTT